MRDTNSVWTETELVVRVEDIDGFRVSVANGQTLYSILCSGMHGFLTFVDKSEG